jgi:hypothetical protein
VAALFEAVGASSSSSSSSSSAACADHCARGLRAALEGALAAGLDAPAALRRAARDLDAAFLSEASLPAWVRASSGATMSAVLLPVSDATTTTTTTTSQQQQQQQRAYAARLGAPPPFVARARGSFSNTTVECVALQGGGGGDSAARASSSSSPTRGAAATTASAAHAPDPHTDGLTLAELLPQQVAKGSKQQQQRLCVRAIGLGYGKDARLAQAWAAHCRRRGGGNGGDNDCSAPCGAPADGHLPPELLKRLQGAEESPFISCEPEVTAHVLFPGEDAAVVLASKALRAALAPGELALLAHGFDAQRLSALRQAYTRGGKAAAGGQAAAWAGVEDCGASSLLTAAAAATRGGKQVDQQNDDLAALPPLPPPPAAPQGEPNVARVLVHVARSRAVDATNREAAKASAKASASAPRLAAGGRLLPKALTKRILNQPLDAADATRLDLAVDGEDLVLALDSRQRQQKRGGKKAAGPSSTASSFDDGTDFATSRVLVLPSGYGAVPGGATADEKEEQQQQATAAAAPATATTTPPPPQPLATKRDVHGDLAAVVLALDWGSGISRSASLGGGCKRAAAVQAASAAAARSSRPAALYRWELVRLAVKARCARRRQLRAAWWAASDALRRAADAAARDAEVAAWRVLGEAVHVTRRGDVMGADAAPSAAAAGGAAGARAVVMLGMGGSAKGPAAAAAAAASAQNPSLRRHRGPQNSLRPTASP